MAISLFACVGPAAIAAAVGRVPASNGKSRRSSVFDNVRFFLEVQVVFSHFVLFLHDKVPTGGSERVWPRGPLDDHSSWDLAWPQVVYESTMVYRMPCFAFIVGLFSKGDLDAMRSQRLLISTVAPILLYTGGPAGYLLGIGRLDQNPIMTDRIDALWFLSAVFIWRLSTVLLRPFSRRGIVVTGCVISAVSPYCFDLGPYNADNTFAYKMALTFFFPFAIGYAAEVREPQLAAVDNWWLRGLSIIGLLLLTLAFVSPAIVHVFDKHCANLYIMDDQFSPHVFEYLGLPPGSCENPNALRVQTIYGNAWAWVPRINSMGLATIFGVLAIVAMPHHTTWYTQRGKLNVYPYMLHLQCLVPLHQLVSTAVPFRKLSRQIDSPNYLVDPAHDTLVWFPYLVIAPHVLTVLLSTRAVRLLTWPVVEPTWLKLLFPGGVQYFADNFAQIHTLAPAHLGLTSRRAFATWLTCEVAVVALISVVNWLAPVQGPKYNLACIVLVVCACGLVELATHLRARPRLCKNGVKRKPSIVHPPAVAGLLVDLHAAPQQRLEQALHAIEALGVDEVSPRTITTPFTTLTHPKAAPASSEKEGKILKTE